MRKTMMVWSACAAALLPALAASTASADGVPVQEIGQVAASEQSAGSSATSTQKNPTNTAIHLAILSPGAASGAVSQSNSSEANSAAGNSNGTAQNASQASGGGGVQGIGQAAGNQQKAESDATSTQSGATNTAIDVAILSPGAGSGDVKQSNSSEASSAAGNSNHTTHNASQAGGGGGGGVQGIGQLSDSRQKAESEATSVQYDPTNNAIHVSILSPGAKSGSVNQSNSSEANSAAGNSNETEQNATQEGGSTSAPPAKYDEKCTSCHAPSFPTVQGIGQAAYNDQKAESEATSTQYNPSNTAIDLPILIKDMSKEHGKDSKDGMGGYEQPKSEDPMKKFMEPSKDGKGGSVEQSNSSEANSAAGNSNETKQNASQAGSGFGGVQGIGQLALNAQKAKSSATSTQWCPANVAFGADRVKQENESEAASAAGNRNDTKQNALQALAGHLRPVVL